MVNSSDHERSLIRYLLGEATAQEQERIEEELLANDGAFARLGVAEDDLIDAYVRDELIAGERRLFEERWLNCPRRLARVEFARELLGLSETELARLRGAVSAEPEHQPADRASWWLSIFPRWELQPLAALTVIALAAAGGVIAWLQADNAALSSRLAVLEAARQASPEVRGSAPLGGTLPIYLLEPVTRSSSVQKLAVSVQESVVRLRAVVDDGRDYRSIEVTLGRGRDETIAAWQLEPDRAIVVEVPVSLIHASSGAAGNRFHLKLQGRDDQGQLSTIGYHELEIEFYSEPAESF